MAQQDDKKPPPPKAKAGEFGSAFDKGPNSPRTSSVVSLPKPEPVEKPKPNYPPPRRRRGRFSGPPPKKPEKPAGPPPVMTTFQKQQLGSGFIDSAKQQKREAVIGSSPALFDDNDDDETLGGGNFDGVTAPEHLTGRDTWKALQAPVQSKAGKREKSLYEQVLKQFAVGSNPRYEPDGTDRDRSHIFLWDVSLAMGCEIPHFAGAREHNLSQTTDWVRHEAPMRGWRRVSSTDIYDVAASGQLVVAVPKDPRLKGLAVVHPQKKAFVPVVVSAGVKRGWGVALRDAIGVVACEFFTHP